MFLNPVYRLFSPEYTWNEQFGEKLFFSTNAPELLYKLYKLYNTIYNAYYNLDDAGGTMMLRKYSYN